MRLAQTMAWRTVVRNRMHSALTIVTIALAAGVIMGLRGISGAFVRYGAAVGSNIVQWANGAQTVLMVVVLVCTVPMIASIYGFSARRRTRQLALLAAQGASPKMIRSQLRWEAAFMGLMGLGLGIPLGMLGAWVVLDLNLAASFRLFIGPNKPIPAFAVRISDLVIASGVTALSVGFATARTIRTLAYTAPLARTTEVPDGPVLRKTQPLRGKAPEALARAQIRRRPGNTRLLTVSIGISMIFLLTAHAFVSMLAVGTEAAYGLGQASAEPSIMMSRLDWQPERRDAWGIESPYTEAEHRAQVAAFERADAQYTPLAETVHRVAHAQAASISPEGVGVGVIGVAVEDWKRMGFGPSDIAVLDTDPAPIVLTEMEYDSAGEVVQREVTLAVTQRLDSAPEWFMDIMPYLGSAEPVVVVPIERVRELLVLTTIYYRVSYRFSEEGYEAFQALPPPGSGVSVSDLTQRLRVQAAGNHIVSLLSIGFVVLMTLVSVSGLVHALLSSYRVRAPEIGILMSIGMTEAQLLRMFLWEGRLYVWKGLVIGGVIGLGLHRLLWWLQFDQHATDVYGAVPWAVPAAPVAAVMLGVGAIVGGFAWAATRVIRQQRDWIRLIRKGQ